MTYQDIGYSFDAVENVLGYTNSAAGYETNQRYTYDGLYQLVKAEGDSIGRSGAGTGLYDYETHYEQAFSFDMIGNMTEKKSRTRSPYANPPGVNLDYESQYTYKQGTHQAIQIGSARYEYDGNGNVIIERYGNTDTPTGNKKTHEVREEDGVYSTDYGFALTLGSTGSGSANTERRYVWNERNLLKRSSDGQYAVEYRYGADGQRAIKYAVKQGGSGERTETLYYNKWYQLVSTNDNLRMVESKHIYVGETRIATKQRHDDNSNYSEELKHTYYYHGDHLGSAQVVTNGVGEIYEHIEYTPYGELWVDHTKRIGSEEGTPFRFTGKEFDEETGLYYYGARYLDPKTSRWISTDPAMGEYIPSAPINDEAKKRNQNLPGMGGVFNYVNLHMYHYAGNNPIKLKDPDGRHLEFEGDTIKSDLTVDDLRQARAFMENNNNNPAETQKYNKVMAKDKNGDYLTFVSPAAIGVYLSDDEEMASLRSVVDTVGLVGLFTSALASHKYAGAFYHLRNTGEAVSNYASGIIVGLDVLAFMGDRDPENLLNAGITALSFIPGIGSLASVEVMYGKEAAKVMAREFAQLDSTLKHDPLSLLDAAFNYLSNGWNFGDIW